MSFHGQLVDNHEQQLHQITSAPREWTRVLGSHSPMSLPIETSPVQCELCSVCCVSAENVTPLLGSTVDLTPPYGFIEDVALTLASWRILLLTQPSWRTSLWPLAL